MSPNQSYFVDSGLESRAQLFLLCCCSQQRWTCPHDWITWRFLRSQLQSCTIHGWWDIDLGKFHHDLTVLPSPGIMVTKGNHPQMALRFSSVIFLKIHPDRCRGQQIEYAAMAAWARLAATWMWPPKWQIFFPCQWRDFTIAGYKSASPQAHHFYHPVFSSLPPPKHDQKWLKRWLG